MTRNHPTPNRRGFFARAGAVAGGAALLQDRLPLAQLRAPDSYPSPEYGANSESEPKPTSDGSTRIFAPDGVTLPYRPVVTLNNATLPWKIVEGVKVFHLVAEPVVHEFAPGLISNCRGYSGRVHGPTFEAVEGDRVRLYVTNRLPAPTTVHWHGILLPSGMDGVGGVSQKAIQPGETFKYEFTLQQHGTYMSHSHHDEMPQMQLGLMGMFIIHPKNPKSPPPDRD